MTMKLYVGNLAFSTDEDAIQRAFSRCGAVDDVTIVMDRETGRSHGFAFVTMADVHGARKAIADLNGGLVDGRALRVSEAQPRQAGAHHGDRRGGF